MERLEEYDPKEDEDREESCMSSMFGCLGILTSCCVVPAIWITRGVAYGMPIYMAVCY